MFRVRYAVRLLRHAALVLLVVATVAWLSLRATGGSAIANGSIQSDLSEIAAHQHERLKCYIQELERAATAVSRCPELLVALRAGADPDQRQRAIARLSRAQQRLADRCSRVYATDCEGRVLSRDLARQIAPWVRGPGFVRSLQRPFLTDLMSFRRGDEFHTFLLQPVFDAGEPVGVVVFELPTQSIAAVVGASDFGEGVRITLSTPDGYPVVGTQRELARTDGEPCLPPTGASRSEARWPWVVNVDRARPSLRAAGG